MALGPAALEAQIQPRQKQVEGIFQDQERLRENLKVLKGSAEGKALVQRYTQQLNEQESRLETLRREIAELQEKLQQGRAELDKMLQELVLDVSL